MRPPGEIHQALLGAARELFTPERAPTLAELREHAQVGNEAARRTVENMSRHGLLRKVRNRRVSYRNRPVAEYAPADLVPEQAPGEGAGFVDLAAVWSETA